MRKQTAIGALIYLSLLAGTVAFWVGAVYATIHTIHWAAE